MSVDLLRLIPVDPKFTPSAEVQQRTGKLFRSFFPATVEVNANITTEVKFVDQGQNFERVLCPFCNSVIETKWWQSAMDTAQTNGFDHLAVITPCCGTNTSLNDLEYEWPAGFARFVLEAHDPQIDLNDQQMQGLVQTIGIGLRKIWAHY